MTSALLEAGAPLGVRNTNGETAFEIVTAPAPQEEDPELERALAESRRQADEDEAQLAAALAASALESPSHEAKTPEDEDLARALEASKQESTPPQHQQQQKGFFGRWFGKSGPEDDLDAAVAASLAAEDEDVRRRRRVGETRRWRGRWPRPSAARGDAAAAAAATTRRVARRGGGGRRPPAPRAAPASPAETQAAEQRPSDSGRGDAEVARRPKPPASPTLSRRPPRRPPWPRHWPQRQPSENSAARPSRPQGAGQPLPTLTTAAASYRSDVAFACPTFRSPGQHLETHCGLEKPL